MGGEHSILENSLLPVLLLLKSTLKLDEHLCLLFPPHLKQELSGDEFTI